MCLQHLFLKQRPRSYYAPHTEKEILVFPFLRYTGPFGMADDTPTTLEALSGEKSKCMTAPLNKDFGLTIAGQKIMPTTLISILTDGHKTYSFVLTRSRPF